MDAGKVAAGKKPGSPPALVNNWVGVPDVTAGEPLPQPRRATCSGVCCSCVPAGSVGVVQRFGDFAGYHEPGLNFYCFPCETVKYTTLAVQQMKCVTECKTKDNVTLTVTTAVQYRIDKLRVKEAVFEIQEPRRQISALCDNIVRSTLPQLELDEAYSAKDRLCLAILCSVRDSMRRYGYEILEVLVVDITPEQSVLSAMNEINVSRRRRDSAMMQGEAHKILQVKAAEADAEAKHLSGVGIAKMRKAIADGFRDSVKLMGQGGLTSLESLHMMVTVQYLDTLRDFATNPSAQAIMVPHGPGAVKHLSAQL